MTAVIIVLHGEDIPAHGNNNSDLFKVLSLRTWAIAFDMVDDQEIMIWIVTSQVWNRQMESKYRRLL